MSPSEFAAKWSGSWRTERAAAQEHFIDLCRMLGVPTPNEADPIGDWYAFEKGVDKVTGGDGFADVWKRDHFAWEYKGKRKDLDAAYQQLLLYREALDNPPLLVVCDLARFEVHTNFTGTAKVVHEFNLHDLRTSPEEALRVLRAVMSAPYALKPLVTPAELTEKAAAEFAQLAAVLRARGHESPAVAHFLSKLLFCMFAEDSDLLPKGLINRLAEQTRDDPGSFSLGVSDLFGKMSSGGGLFGADRIQWFNGGLFDGPENLPLTVEDIAVVRSVSQLDWSQVEPAIFGTLFERGLDPDKRMQLGAHYTDRDSIEKLVEPVLMSPLRRDFEQTKAAIETVLSVGRRWTQKTPLAQNPTKIFAAFLERLRSVRVLDPACGSGNFLYIALQALKDLEREANLWVSLTLKVPIAFPEVGPQAVHGIEINPYAADLARVTIWIGEIQWMLKNGFAYLRDPILRPLETIECRDALLDWSEPGKVQEATWPAANVIVSNPPFLGSRLLISGLGPGYVAALFGVYSGRVSQEADFVVYWWEKARAMVKAGSIQRVGLLATQAIRGGSNRQVLNRIKQTGDIFLAWSDQDWILDGAAVHISFVGFDNGSETDRVLDGRPVSAINPNLTAGLDLTKARRLRENQGVAFQGPVKIGAFDIPGDLAAEMLKAPNPDGRPNSEVVKPWVNGQDIGGRPRGWSIIDFQEMPIEVAALYEEPFEYVKQHVFASRQANRRLHRRENWWLHGETGSGVREATRGMARFIVTPRVSKHRLFTWVPANTLPDSAVIAFAKEDDFTFGVLHSRCHELWARGTGTQLREVESGFRYTPQTTFETFPFPQQSDEQQEAVAQAARRLDEFRRGWLNPAGAAPEELKLRTLTKLYNKPPTWMFDCHKRLNEAVLAAYGWPSDITDDDLLTRLYELNQQRWSRSGGKT